MAPGFSLDERRGVAILAILFVVCTAFVLSFHHSFAKPTIPDEKAYYGWAELYNQGYLAVPLQDWYGLKEQAPSSQVRLFVDVAGVHFLRVRAEVASLDGIGGMNDITAWVTWEDGRPVPGAVVTARLPPPSPPFTVIANATGQARFLNVPSGFFPVEATFGIPRPPPTPPWQLRAGDFVAVGRQEQPYRTYLEIDACDPVSREVTVRARDSFDEPMSGARANFTFASPTGRILKDSQLTDANGEARFVPDSPGGYEIVASKAPIDLEMRMGSVVVVDGRYYMVNRWPPGYQIFLAPFVRAGLAEFTTLFLMAIASASVHVMARRLFDWRVAFLSAILFLTCGLCLILVFEVGMADYASMTFAAAGLALFVEALGREAWKWLAFFLQFLAGLSLAVSVWMRYSTITVVAIPLLYLLVLLFKESREERGKIVPTKAGLFRGLRRAVPLLIGLLLLGLPLAQYNATYFGSPFATGYNFGQLAVEGEGENATGVLSGGAFYENFNPASALPTIPYRLVYLLALVPFAYLMIPVAWFRRRSLVIWFLVGGFLANFLLYIFVPWVAADFRNVLIATEEMRYFLIGVPPAAVLAGIFLRDLWDRGGNRRVHAICLLVALVAAGFVAAAIGIQLQLNRLVGPPGPPGPP